MTPAQASGWEAGAQAMREAVIGLIAPLGSCGDHVYPREGCPHCTNNSMVILKAMAAIRALAVPPTPTSQFGDTQPRDLPSGPGQATAGEADAHAVWHKDAGGEPHMWTCAVCGVKVNRAELHISHGIDNPPLDLCPPCFRKRKAALAGSAEAETPQRVGTAPGWKAAYDYDGPVSVGGLAADLGMLEPPPEKAEAERAVVAAAMAWDAARGEDALDAATAELELACEALAALRAGAAPEGPR